MWLMLIVIGLAFIAWLLLRSPNRRVPGQDQSQRANSPTLQAEQGRQVVRSIERGEELVTHQTLRANQKPTIELVIEDISVPRAR